MLSGGGSAAKHQSFASALAHAKVGRRLAPACRARRQFKALPLQVASTWMIIAPWSGEDQCFSSGFNECFNWRFSNQSLGLHFDSQGGESKQSASAQMKGKLWKASDSQDKTPHTSSGL